MSNQPSHISRIRTYKVGITGNTCSGKSRVRKLLTKMGLSTIDTSDIMFSIINTHSTLLRQITQKYGKQVMDPFGKLSRRRLDDLLNSTQFDQQFLNESVSPLVRQEIKRFLYGPLGTYMRIVESPLLFETKSEHLYDEVWLVWVDPKVQISRIIQQDGISQEQAHLLIVNEFPQEAKRSASNRIIDNSGDWMRTEAQVRESYEEIKNRAYGSGSLKK